MGPAYPCVSAARAGARVWIPTGDQIIGKGLERVTVLGEDAGSVFADVNETLVAEAAPILETLKMIESCSTA